MTTEILREFTILAEVLNFQLAADMLYISQSTLSRHVALIEKELNIVLLNRVGSKTELTAEGRVFLDYAKRIIQLHEGCIDEITDIQRKVNGVISIGTMYNMNPYYISKIIGEFILKYPNIHVSIKECDTDTITQLLNKGDVDFAFLQERVEKKASFPLYDNELVTQDDIVVMFPPGHPMATEASVGIEQLKNEHFLVTSKSSFGYKYVMNLCRKAGFEPQIRLIGLSDRNLTGLVEQGVGVAVLMKKPSTYINNNIASIVELKPNSKVNINYLCRKNMTSERQRIFNHFVRKYLAEHYSELRR